MQQDASFKAIVNRFNITPVEELPRVSAFLASSLAACPLDVYFSDSKINTVSVTTHKLKTRISALLQDRSQSGRLSAAIFIKTIVETAGATLLSGSEPWARSLVSCLGKSDAPEIKRLYLTTITRIFLLTQHQPTLTREITTPLLPAFLTACLALIRPSSIRSGEQLVPAPSPLLDTVLQCWLQLLPQHASTFRPFLNRIKPICLSIVEDHTSSESTIELSTKLLCSLISCAPKNTASQEWIQMAGSIVAVAHETTDGVFRAVLEEHDSNNSARVPNSKKHNFSKAPATSGKDQLGLAAWKGISEGSSRLAALVSWLQHLISSATTQQIPVPFGQVLDLTARILSVNFPESQGRPGPNLRFHNETGKEEKEELLLNLPKLHISCLTLLWSLCQTFEQTLLPVYRTICDQILNQFQSSSWNHEIRVFCYDIIGHIMNVISLSELEFNRSAFSIMITQSCNDLKTALSNMDPNQTQDMSKGHAMASDASRIEAGQSMQRLLKQQSSAFASAWRLLPVLLGRGTASIIPRQSRAELERLAIILNHQEAMLASVLNSVVSDGGSMATASILPFLARAAMDTAAVEAMLRPRLPPLQAEVAQSRSHNLDASMDITSPEKVEAGDILSQLENSINEMDKESMDGGSANEPNRDPVVSGEPSLSPKKRTFEDVKETEAQAAIAELTQSEMRSPKRPRPDEVHDPLPASMDYQGQDTIAMPVLADRHSLPRNSSSSEQYSGLPDQRPTVPEVPSTLNKEDKYDSDSSDFEIPKIDTGLDTDEEEDEDEEGQ